MAGAASGTWKTGRLSRIDASEQCSPVVTLPAIPMTPAPVRIA